MKLKKCKMTFKNANCYLSVHKFPSFVVCKKVQKFEMTRYIVNAGFEVRTCGLQTYINKTIFIIVSIFLS